MTDTPTTPDDPTTSIPPTERLLYSLEALRSSDVLDGAGEPRDDVRSAGPHSTIAQHGATDGTAVVEQAQGVLILRYAINADHAFDLRRRWARDADVEVRTGADTLVTAVCQGHTGPRHDPTLVRWLEERLRGKLPTAVAPRRGRQVVQAQART